MNTIRDRTRRLLQFIVCCQVTLIATAFADSLDVFPLAPGLCNLYRYKETFTSWSYGSYLSSKDSGTVGYFVVDSTVVNDTTVAWLVRERLNVLRWVHRFPPLFDTVYSVLDSTVTTLTEITTGYHELRCSTLVWSFDPALFGVPMFRFSDSSHVLMAQRFPPCMTFANPTNYDSLWFSSDSGLVNKASSRCNDHDEWGSAFWQNSNLLSRTLVSVGERMGLARQSALLSNYPNPFNPTTTITYDLLSRSDVVLAVYDFLGCRVALLAEGVQEAGRHEHTFSGLGLSSAVYIVHLQVAGREQTSKMILLK